MAKRKISVTFDAEDREQLVSAMATFLDKLEGMERMPVSARVDAKLSSSGRERTAEQVREQRLANLAKGREKLAERRAQTARENPAPAPSEASRSSIADAAKRLSQPARDPEPKAAPKASGMDSGAVAHLTEMLADMFAVAERSGKVMWGLPEYKRAKLDREHVWGVAYELCDVRHDRRELSVDEVAWFVAHPEQVAGLAGAYGERHGAAAHAA